VTGKKVSTQKPASPRHDRLAQQGRESDQWPVTVAMLHRTLHRTTQTQAQTTQRETSEPAPAAAATQQHT